MKKNILILIVLTYNLSLFSQIAPNTYVIKFKDKNNSEYSITSPEKFLSERAIDRRQKYNIPVTKQDIPVNKSYLNKLKEIGLEIYAVSKWFNHAVVFTKDSSLIEKVYELDFVKSNMEEQKIVKKNAEKKEFQKPDIQVIDDTVFAFEYGLGKNQIQMLNGHYLHNRGWQGQGMQIALLDAGFLKADKLPSLDSLFKNNQILGIRDFVARDDEVYKDDSHGMQVLSTIGGNLPGKLVGTAPKAKFWLLRTEEAASEYIVEEYYWISGAEFADSIGVDLIHTSLGYNNFDDKVNSHKYEDMNGDVAPISICADIAASKGILVCTSAGNEGNDPWKYISAPADADSALSVGSVGAGGKLSGFSSRGPTSDNRVKPDVMAQGSFSYVQGTSGSITFSFGTSFSGPIIAGAVACLWQANPTFNNMQIIEAIQKSCSKYDKPDGNYGYGIPDFAKADTYLKQLKKEKEKEINN